MHDAAMTKIEEITISDWKEMLSLATRWPTDIYRGQSNAEWELSSSLQRCLKGTDYEKNPTKMEFWFLREFRKRARLYLKQVPEASDIVGWLSLMQHYGTPTRLIDFTHSFYVACYFALIDAKSDAAVWSINHEWLLSTGHDERHCLLPTGDN